MILGTGQGAPMNQLEIFHFESDKPSFDDLGQENGFRFWYARDLMSLLEYSDYSSFKRVINKATQVCLTLDIEVKENFEQVTRNIEGKDLSDYKLSKFACYLVAMNGDVKKIGVARAQTYFITLTEAFKRYIKEADQVERISIRGEISEREKSLSSIAQEAGVYNYAFFQNKGYLGLYNMSIKQLKARKSVPESKSMLDFMGKEELAANLFRITQTEAKIRNENIKGQDKLEDTAFVVGRTVRQTMETISGTKPEDLPISSDIKEIKSKIKSTHKEFVKIENQKKKRIPAD